MCGIVGYFGNVMAKQEAAFDDLLQVDVIRGADSTGLMTVNRGFDVSTYKSLALPTDFLESKRARKLLNANNIAVVGHNRAATKGAVTSKNAHPFEVGKIVGVHNGTLRNKWELPDHSKFDVDSENLFHSFDKEGVEATIRGVDGAYALVWVDKEANTFNILRNSERPLHWFQQEDDKAFWFGSEPKMMEWILHRRGIKWEKSGMFPENQWYVFPLDYQGANLPEYEAKEVLGLEKKLFTGNRGGHYGQTTGATGGSTTNGKGGKRDHFNHRKNSKVMLERSAEYRGKKWKIGDRVEFYVEDVQDATGGGKRVVATASDDTEQEVVLYIKNDHPFAKNIDDYGTEWYGEVSNMVWGGVDRNPDVLGLFVNPKSIGIVEDEDNKGNVIQLPNSPRDSEGNVISPAEFVRLTEAGCAMCGDPVSPKDSGDILWLQNQQKNDFCCKSCLKEDWVVEFLTETNELKGDTLQ